MNSNSIFPYIDYDEFERNLKKDTKNAFLCVKLVDESRLDDLI